MNLHVKWKGCFTCNMSSLEDWLQDEHVENTAVFFKLVISWRCQYRDYIYTIIYECGSVGGMIIDGGRGSTWSKFASVPLCPQIPHGLTCDKTRAAVVGSRWITAWATALPTLRCSFNHMQDCFLIGAQRKQWTMSRLPAKFSIKNTNISLWMEGMQ
jgi:hypothetical protein